MSIPFEGTLLIAEYNKVRNDLLHDVLLKVQTAYFCFKLNQ